MSAQLTEEEFSKHVNTKFQVASEEPIELELTEVKAYLSQPNEQIGRKDSQYSLPDLPTATWRKRSTR